MSSPLSFAQISDCHLYADKRAQHHGANVFENLCTVLNTIKTNHTVEFVIFTGDLTQDHTDDSYKNFVEAIELIKFDIPIYYLAGNHDEFAMFEQYFTLPIIHHDKTITRQHWQLQLISSKSSTPSGVISIDECKRLLTSVDGDKNQLVLMHHHPVNVEYFIDRHGLKNKHEFYQVLSEIPNLRALACGHVHNAMTLSLGLGGGNTPVFTCPATSIQFDTKALTVANASLPAGFRLFKLYESGEIETHAMFLGDSINE